MPAGSAKNLGCSVKLLNIFTLFYAELHDIVEKNAIWEMQYNNDINVLI